MCVCVCVFCVKLLSFFQFCLNPLNEVEELCTKKAIKQITFP